MHKMNTGWALRLHFSSISSCCQHTKRHKLQIQHLFHRQMYYKRPRSCLLW